MHCISNADMPSGGCSFNKQQVNRIKHSPANTRLGSSNTFMAKMTASILQHSSQHQLLLLENNLTPLNADTRVKFRPRY
jgi:hypothetical protein